MRRYDGVIFDMDGTLIESLLDFGVIRTDLGIGPQDGVLEAIEAMVPDRRAAAHLRLLEHELTAARRAKLTRGALQAVGAIRRAGLKTALLTRNAREAMELVLARFAGLQFDLTWSRENGPIKPEPDGILRACKQLGLPPERTACVGDFHYDITAANAAGAVSILLVPGEHPPWACEAHHVISRLDELPDLLGL